MRNVKLPEEPGRPLLRRRSRSVVENWTMDQSDRRLVLIVEDEAIIAVNLQDEFQDAGFKVAGPFTTCGAALEWLGNATPHAAVLDSMLSDGACRDIARDLSRRNVPFLVYSGHRSDDALRAEFPTVTWIEKPAPPAALIEACQSLIGLR